MKTDEIAHSWNTLRTSVQDHIGSLNWGYRVQLRENSIKYLNAYAQFTGPNTVKVGLSVPQSLALFLSVSRPIPVSLSPHPCQSLTPSLSVSHLVPVCLSPCRCSYRLSIEEAKRR